MFRLHGKLLLVGVDKDIQHCYAMQMAFATRRKTQKRNLAARI